MLMRPKMVATRAVVFLNLQYLLKAFLQYSHSNPQPAKGFHVFVSGYIFDFFVELGELCKCTSTINFTI